MSKAEKIAPRLDVLAERLQAAWVKYEWLFGEPPHGTLKQLRALVELEGVAAALESYAREEREREVDAAAKWLIARGYISAGEALRRDRPTPTIAARIREGQ